VAAQSIFFYLPIVGGGVQTGSTRHRGHLLSYCAWPGWLWGWRIIRWNKDWQGKPKYSEKICPSATLSTTNPTWPHPGLNPGPRGGKPATNRLSYGAVWPRGLRHELSSLTRKLGSWVRIPLKAWLSVLVCVYSVFVLFCMQVEALRRADPPSTKTYQLCIGSGKWKKGPRPNKGL
jgi:hypothetical protein